MHLIFVKYFQIFESNSNGTCKTLRKICWFCTICTDLTVSISNHWCSLSTHIICGKQDIFFKYVYPIVMCRKFYRIALSNVGCKASSLAVLDVVVTILKNFVLCICYDKFSTATLRHILRHQRYRFYILITKLDMCKYQIVVKLPHILLCSVWIRGKFVKSHKKWFMCCLTCLHTIYETIISSRASHEKWGSRKSLSHSHVFVHRALHIRHFP